MAKSAKANEIVEAARTPPTSPEMVRTWFVLLSSFLNWHPDTRFEEYVERSSGERVFSNNDARICNECMACCFDICAHDPELIYNLGIETLKAAMGEALIKTMHPVASEEHWSSPNGCHSDCPACAENRTDEEDHAHDVSENAGLYAKELLDTLDTLIDHLTESHHEELDNNHFGDSSCSYCEDIAKARALMLKVDPRRTDE